MWLVIVGVVLALAVRYLAMLSFLLSTLPGGAWVQTSRGKLRRSVVTGLFRAATNALNASPWAHLGLVIAGLKNPVGVLGLLAYLAYFRDAQTGQIVMEVENHPKWKETNIRGTHFPLP